jgi:hypothetical protein
MMLRKNSTIWITVLMGLVILGLACDAQMDEANKLINEANPLIDKSKPLSEKARNQINDLMGSKMTQAEDIDQYKTDNKTKFDEIVSLSEQCEKNFSEAAGKFEQAATKKLDEKFKEYVGLKAQEFKKDAEKHKMTAAFLKAFLAEKDAAKADQSIADYNKKNDDLMKEANDLDAKAEKIVKDNPSLFKPN